MNDNHDDHGRFSAGGGGKKDHPLAKIGATAHLTLTTSAHVNGADKPAVQIGKKVVKGKVEAVVKKDGETHVRVDAGEHGKHWVKLSNG